MRGGPDLNRIQHFCPVLSDKGLGRASQKAEGLPMKKLGASLYLRQPALKQADG
jgi:hypothetical protein